MIDIDGSYFNIIAYFRYNPISRAEFDQEVFQYFFNETFAPPSPPSDSASSHRLALMFIVLAIGTLMDPHEEPYSINAEKFHQLARAALFKSSFFDDPTLHAVQALVSTQKYTPIFNDQISTSARHWIRCRFGSLLLIFMMECAKVVKEKILAHLTICVHMLCGAHTLRHNPELLPRLPIFSFDEFECCERCILIVEFFLPNCSS